MRIEVTADDIAKGQRSTCARCPIAIALQRATGDHAASVGYIWLSFNRSFEATPKAAREFIKAFDEGDQVYPFSFEIPEPAATGVFTTGDITREFAVACHELN